MSIASSTIPPITTCAPGLSSGVPTGESWNGSAAMASATLTPMTSPTLSEWENREPTSTVATDAAGMKILVTGSRRLTAQTLVHSVLHERWVRTDGVLTVIHGDCPTGADRFASNWCSYMQAADHQDVEEIPVAAELFGSWPACGPRRNSYMVSVLQPHICFGFFRHGEANRGTTDTVMKAIDAGIPIRTFWSD